MKIKQTVYESTAAWGPETAYSQVDPAYKGIALGTSTSTIGGVGCLMTSLASGLTDLGVTINGRVPDPPQLNRWLARNGGFVNSAGGTTNANLLVFGVVNRLAGVRLAKFVDCRKTSAPMTEIAGAIAAGKVVLVEVDFTPGGTLQQHWVRLLPERPGVSPAETLVFLGSDARIMDPWMPPGSEFRWLMTCYALPGWDTPARAIMRVAIYEPTEESPSAPREATAQPAVHLRIANA